MARRGLILAAPTSGAGKTTVTLAVLAALHRQGVSVAGGKAGPDYIDPAFHTAACGQPSLNFDAWAMAPEALRAQAAAVPSDLLLIEGAMGALDGAGRAARGSVADLAEILGMPLVLVIDTARQGASAALPVAGLQAMRPGLNLAGVLLNRLGSARHGDMAADAIRALGVPVLGRLPRAPELALPERHLGLVQAAENRELPAFLDRAAAWMAANADLAALAAMAGPLASAQAQPTALAPLGQRIAIARDTAFAFAYPHLLDGWRRAGAEVLPFSPLLGEGPKAAADAVFLPGGYPELHAGALAASEGFHKGMAAAAARGAVIYGECGGYMALGEGLVDAQGARHRMLGLLPLETSFAARKLSLGYRALTALEGAPFSGPLAGHEFHFAQVISEGAAPRLFAATDADGEQLQDMGLRFGSVSGSFAHVICPGPAVGTFDASI